MLTSPARPPVQFHQSISRNFLWKIRLKNVIIVEQWSISNLQWYIFLQQWRGSSTQSISIGQQYFTDETSTCQLPCYRTTQTWNININLFKLYLNLIFNCPTGWHLINIHLFLTLLPLLFAIVKTQSQFIKQILIYVLLIHLIYHWSVKVKCSFKLDWEKTTLGLAEKRLP